MSPNGNPVYPNGSMAEFDLLARKHFELTDSMLKLLYLIGKYARCAENIGDNEGEMGEALQLANLGGEPCVPNHVHSSTGVPLGMHKSKLALAKRLPTLGVVHGVHICD